MLPLIKYEIVAEYLHKHHNDDDVIYYARLKLTGIVILTGISHGLDLMEN